MKLIDALQLPSLKQSRVAAGADGLNRTIRWVDIVDMPDPLPWVRSGDFLLTTGQNWPHDEARQRSLISELSKRGLTGVGLAVPHFFENMPPAACAIADGLQFPLIEIPWEVQFSSISEEILNSILMIQYQLQEQSRVIHQELMRIALEAKDLQEITQSLNNLIGKSVMIQHPEGPLLSTCTDGEEMFPDGMFALPENQERPFTLRSIPRARKIPAIPESGLPTRLVCPILIKKELVGLLWIIEGEQPFSELDLQAAQHASIVMALHISQQRALASLEAQLGYSFLDTLLEGPRHLTPQILHRASLLGFDPDGTYSVGIVTLNSSVPLSREGIEKRQRLFEKLKNRLQQLKIPAVLSMVHNQIIFLIPERIQATHIWESVEDPSLSFVVSLPHIGFDNIRQGYKEVRSILPHIGYGQIHYYRDLMVPRVLMGDSDARTSFLSNLFDTLHKRKNGDVLVHTLLSFAESGFLLNKTAEQLKIHPKTLRYRLDRIIDLGGFHLNEAETQFQLQLAVRLAKLDSRS
jgi:purine catabolism regulator